MWNQQHLGSSTPIVQGVHVETAGQFNGQKGTPQPKQFNDVAFAVAFYIHLGIMAFFLVTSIGAVDNGNGGGGNSGIVFACTVCSIFACGLSTLALGFMMRFATELVKIALFFSISISLTIGIMGFLSGQLFMGIMGLLSFALGIAYAYFVWHRIPFAAANLNAALVAVKANMGLMLVAYIFLAIGIMWTMWWSVAANGMINAYGSMVMFLFLLSYYWTHQVLQNTVHVTTAGVVGTWWFAPEEASSCCSQAITDSFTRASTYSFGSICFGSLLVAIVQALRQLNRMIRDNEDFSIVVCLIDCILACIEGIMEYLNKWAYVYVGLYGYSYLDAGRNVMTLFQNKGWTVIITDDLAENVLFMISVGIGLITGLIGLILASLDQNLFANFEDASPTTIGFGIGLLIGILLSSIMMGTVASAVNTIIVCFAEAPREFEINHPELSISLREAWRAAYNV